MPIYHPHVPCFPPRMGILRCSAAKNNASFLWDTFPSWSVSGPSPGRYESAFLGHPASVCLSAGGHLFMSTSEIFLDPTRDSRLWFRSQEGLLPVFCLSFLVPAPSPQQAPSSSSRVSSPSLLFPRLGSPVRGLLWPKFGIWAESFSVTAGRAAFLCLILSVPIQRVMNQGDVFQ